MDQDSGRRRSSRLAAKGVTPTPKAEIVKKTLKSTEKPKRSKRKTTEEVIELPDAKKTKTNENSIEDESEGKETNNVNNESMDVDKVEANESLQSSVEKSDASANEDKPDAPLKDPNEEAIEKVSDAKDENLKDDVPLTSDEKKPEVVEEPIKIKDPETTEPQTNDISQEDAKQEPVLENNKIKSDDKEKIESVEEDDKKNNISEVCLISNGNTVDQVKSTNGDESVPEPKAVETIKALHDDTNHVVETDIKTITTPTAAITVSNDTSPSEQVENQLNKVVDNVVDDISVSVDANTPNVDQPSTVVS